VTDRLRLREMLVRHEGVRLKPYRCSAGKITIGVGRNLEDVGITHFEAMALLSGDMERVVKEAVNSFPWFQSLSVVRQDVVLNMIFNLGIHRFQGFHKMISAIVRGNFEEAAQEMLASKWSDQVGIRALELARMMRTNIYV
jgi:lysozyme